MTSPQLQSHPTSPLPQYRSPSPQSCPPTSSSLQSSNLFSATSLIPPISISKSPHESPLLSLHFIFPCPASQAHFLEVSHHLRFASSAPSFARPSEPFHSAGARRTSIVWFRNDLRVHDNECLNSANDESLSLLPVYCFDPRDYGKSTSGFGKTGPHRASFLIQSVSNLRENLKARGSELVIRIGKPECVLVELAKEVGADAVYSHREVSHNEVKSEEKIEAVMKDEGLEVKYFWGITSYHVEDLPFKFDEMPTNYGGFKEKVQGLEIRKTIAALDQLKGKPARGDVEPGDVPTLTDLGLNPNASLGQDGKQGSMVGGETEALQRLQNFATEYRSRPSQGFHVRYLRG